MSNLSIVTCSGCWDNPCTCGKNDFWDGKVANMRSSVPPPAEIEKLTLVLAQRLSGYDVDTWKRLKPDRQRTYIRAATTLRISWPSIKEFVESSKLVS